MTRVRAHTRNDLALDAIDDVVRETLNAPAPVRWSVAAVDNHSGEPSFYIYIEMPNESDIPDLATRNRLVAALLAALEKIEDDRFPYLSFGPREGDIGHEEIDLDGSED